VGKGGYFIRKFGGKEKMLRVKLVKEGKGDLTGWGKQRQRGGKGTVENGTLGGGGLAVCISSEKKYEKASVGKKGKWQGCSHLRAGQKEDEIRS